MKKLILILVLTVLGVSKIISQNVSSDTSLYWMYSELIGTRKILSTKVNVEIDFGQSHKWFGIDRFITDPDTGKPRSFNSMVDAMNFMGENDWEFVQAYVVTEGQQNVYRWLLKRACKRGEKGEYIPMTKSEYKRIKE